MPTTKHTATHEGQTFTRTSKTRVYSHVVLAKTSLDNALARIESDANIDAHRSNYRYYLRCINGPHKARPSWRSEESYASEIERYRQSAIKELAGTSSKDEYVAKKQAQARAWVEQDRLDGCFDRWVDCGWCSRRDLAEKSASAHRSNPYYSTAVVVEARKETK